MAEQTDGGQATGTAPADQQAASGTNQIDNLNAALRAEREQRQALKAKLDEIEAAKAAEAKAAAEAKGNFEKLYRESETKLTDYEKRIKSYEEKEAKRIESTMAETDTILKAMSEEDRALVPEGIDPEQRLMLARKLADRLRQTRPAGTHSNTGAQIDVIPDEAREMAIRVGKKTEDEVKAFVPVWLKTSAGKAWKAKQSGK